MRPIYLNGRFLSQPITGVQRFAREMTGALDRLWDRWSQDPPTLLLPATFVGQIPNYQHIRVRRIGRLSGHIWEQFELPNWIRGGILVNLANSAPLFARRQIVVLHDAGVFVHPEAYSRSYCLFHKMLERILARSKARLATVSAFSRDELSHYLHIEPSRLALLTEGSDHILRIPSDRTIIEQYGLVSRNYVLVVGSLVAHKNLSSLGNLAEMLASRGLHLVIAGVTVARVFDTRKMTLPSSAIYLGRISDSALRALYAEAICLVFPSLYEGYGIPPVEAMACGCPVVSGTAGAVKEVCGDAALYCDPDVPQDFSAAVARLIDEPGLADVMRKRGSDRVKKITWDNAAHMLEELIKRYQREIEGINQ
jgi:glycosyltransferase involved in cell wall biosynthesis